MSQAPVKINFVVRGTQETIAHLHRVETGMACLACRAQMPARAVVHVPVLHNGKIKQLALSPEQLRKIKASNAMADGRKRPRRIQKQINQRKGRVHWRIRVKPTAFRIVPFASKQPTHEK